MAAEYPGENRADFQRDLNSSVARAVARYVENYPGGGLWAKRFSCEFLPESSDIEEYFFYIVLQPVQDGLVDRISEYPGYNCFHDAVNGVKRRFKVINWAAYNERKRWNKVVNLKDYQQVVELTYKRLPGYESLSQDEYKKLMFKKLEERRLEILQRRSKPCAGAEALRATRPGARPRNTKTSTRNSHRPRILCTNHERRAHYRAWYFGIYFAFKEASKLFREGNLTTEFPDGTYRPPIFGRLRDRIRVESAVITSKTPG